MASSTTDQQVGVRISFLKRTTGSVSILSSNRWQNVHDNTSHLDDHVQDHTTSRQHQPQRVGALRSHHPAWMWLHAGGSWSIPTVHQRHMYGRPWVAHKHHTRPRAAARLNYFHGSGASSLKLQIYETPTTTELDDKIKYESIPGTDTFNIQLHPTGSPAGDPTRDSAGYHRESPR